MSVLEKKYVRKKAKMKHPSNIEIMDEADREVMNLTDRAFKSLCIGDEAIYNDSEILLTPVYFNKLISEEIPKNSCQDSALNFEKHKAYQSNCVYDKPYQMKNTSTVSTLFVAFAGEKNNDPKMTNVDSWDKAALLSLQTELSEFSIDYYKPSEKGKNKSKKDIFNLSGKSSKNQHSKSAKIKKLNSINFFLHSEFSPFQTWDNLNRVRLDNMELFPCSSPAEFYESPIYKKNNNSNRLHERELNKRETIRSTSPPEQKDKIKSNFSHGAAQKLKTVPFIQENNSELNFVKLPDIKTEKHNPQMILTSSKSLQRCQSEGDVCAPWRKSRNKSKGVVQPFICSSACERSKTVEQGVIQSKQEVKRVDKDTCLSSTPFNILQLLTPVLPSTQETGTSEILQSVQWPTPPDIPALHETKIYSSPDFKKEDYKSKALSLLFNLKDNRKRVKATYSPPKFKGIDAVDQAKVSSLTQFDVTQNAPGFKNMLTIQKNSLYTKSPVTTDIHKNSTLPDDFLGLSLLLPENKGAKKKPLAKAKYPSLNIYSKSNSGELHTKNIPVEAPVFHYYDYFPVKNSKDLQTKQNFIKPEINNMDHEYTHQNNVGTADKALTEKTNVVILKDKYPILKDCNAQEDMGGRYQDTSMECIFLTKEKSHIKESKPKHKFSAQQNNYIKNQRYVNIGHDDDDDDKSEYWKNDVNSAEKGNVQELRDYSVTNYAFTKCHYSHPLKKDLGICSKQEVNYALSMKGNTSAKIELFTFKEKPYNSVLDSINKNIVKDRCELATWALEKKNAESEQRKKKSDRQLGQDFFIKGEHSKESMLTLGWNATSKNVKPGSQEQKAISNLTATSSKGQSMSYFNINHNDCHLNDLKLDEPSKQEDTAKHSTKLKETVDMPGNICFGQKSSDVQDYFHNKIIRVSKNKLDKSIQEKALPKKGRANSLIDNKAINKKQRKEDVGGVEEILHKVKDSDTPQDKGPVTGKISSLMQKVISVQEMPCIIVQECLGHKANSKIDSFHEKSKNDSKSTEKNKVNLDNINRCVTINEEDKEVTSNSNQNASNILRKKQTILKNHGKNFSKKSLTDHFEKLDETSYDSTVSTLNLLNPDNVSMDRITHSDILNQTEPSLLVGGKQLEPNNSPSKLTEDCSFSHKTDKSPYNSHNSDLAVHTQYMEKEGCVCCLIESACSLSPTCDCDVSSSTLEKPTLFKVKDNTVRAPVTKRLKPILYKSVAGVTQPWSSKESLSGSERCEVDPDLLKEKVQSPTFQITQPNQSSVQVVSLCSQYTTEIGKNEMIDSFIVKEKEYCQVSDGIASSDICANDTVKELEFNIIPLDSLQEAKTPSERTDSACSGIENLCQGKPPTVPLKTEKAMRRAMKLTTKRIQKAEAKSKSDRGRSNEKGSCHKRERRHHSSDKVFSDRSYQQEHTINRAGHSTDENSSETSLQKSQTKKRNKDNLGKKLNSSLNSSLISMDRDAQSSATKKQNEIQSLQKNPFDSQEIKLECERMGRTSKKNLPQKLYRRAQSLDRLLSGKYEHSILGSRNPTSKANTKTLEKLTTAETSPLPQNSIEHTYGSSANNMVSQAFPMTQRKLLQDLDSGQYFVVDMPVQVKTKTFFDPETGSYVQLPVQSLEGSVPRAQSVEVVNASSLMLYHGFVPVTVSSLP